MKNKLQRETDNRKEHTGHEFSFMPRINCLRNYKPTSSKCAKPYDKANTGGILLGMTPLQQYSLATDNSNIFRNYAINSYNHSKFSPAVFSAICFSINVFIFRAALPLRLSLIVLTLIFILYSKKIRKTPVGGVLRGKLKKQ